VRSLSRLKPLRTELFLLLLAILPALVVAFANRNTILDWYSSDDGFYYFQVARNLAAGHGFTFDGLNPSNGFHPLWLFLITPLFFFARFDPLIPLRLLIVVSALLSAGSAILLYRILRRFAAEGIAAITATLWIVLPRIHDLTMHSGVEAGLNAFCLLLFWHALVTYESGSSTKVALRTLPWLGFFAALAIFARLDNVFIIAFGAAWLCLRTWQPPPGKRAPGVWRWRVLTGLAFSAPIAVLMFLYLAWNKLGFDTFTPVSGQVKLWWGTLRNTVYGFPVRHAGAFFGQLVTNDSELGPWSLLTAPFYSSAEWLLSVLGQAVDVDLRRVALLALTALTVGPLLALVWKQRNTLAVSARQLGLLPFFAGCMAQITYYKLSGSVAQQPWYWIAEMLLILLLLGLILQAIWVRLQPRSAKTRTRFAKRLTLAAMVLLSLSYVFFITTAFRAPGDGSNHFYLDRARWLESVTQPSERIAITGAGNLAYFIDERTIVNMDGLMNTRAYLDAMKAGRGATYLAQLGVDYVFGNEYILLETNPYAPMLEGHLQPYAVYVFADRELPLWRFVP
jgi:hypothetical protein